MIIEIDTYEIEWTKKKLSCKVIHIKNIIKSKYFLFI
jgi:hypothetical protein